MERLDPDKLTVEYRAGITPVNPIIPRCYTLTHSDETAELFLTIAPGYAYEKINPTRDEVLAEWRCTRHHYELYVYCYVGGPFDEKTAAMRYKIFKRELPLALEAIRYGDRAFFQQHSELDDAPIWIHFDSTYPFYHRVEYWGCPEEYV